MMATHQRKESGCTGNEIRDPWFAIATFRTKGSATWRGTPGLGAVLLGDVHAPLQLGHASHGACTDFRFCGGCRTWYGKRRVSGIWSLSIVVEFRLKQKMQIWAYSRRRNPRVYLKQGPPRTTRALLSLPDRAGNRSVRCRPRRAKPLRGCKNGE